MFPDPTSISERAEVPGARGQPRSDRYVLKGTPIGMPITEQVLTYIGRPLTSFNIDMAHHLHHGYILIAYIFFPRETL